MNYNLEILRYDQPNARKIVYGYIKPSKNNYKKIKIFYFLPHAKSLYDDISVFNAVKTRELINPSAELILLPNTDGRQKPYKLSSSERSLIARGDLSPISQQDLALIRALGFDKNTLFIGTSFGASRCVKFLSLLNSKEIFKQAILLGAPNIVPRSQRGPIKLRKLFSTQAKYVRQETAINFPPKEILKNKGLIKENFWFLIFFYRLISYSFWGNILPINNSINKFFLQNSFFKDLSVATDKNKQSAFIVGTGYNDPVSPIEKYKKYIKNTILSDNLSFYFYEGNHISHSNPNIVANLAMMKKII